MIRAHSQLPAVLAAFVLALLAVAAPAAAQAPADAPADADPAEADPAPAELDPAVFSETIDVRVVNVEVVVEDVDGIRVRGLGPEDFRLMVDGEEKSIDYFTEILGGEALAPPTEDGAEPGVASVPATRPGESVGTSYLVFIDDFFPLERDRNRVIEGLIRDLPALGPADRMAVVAFDGRSVEMLSTWNDSTRDLEVALQRAMGRPAFGLARVAARRTFETAAIGGTANPLAGSARDFGLDAEERVYADRFEAQVERNVAAVVATLRGFAKPPGRKVMLLLTGGGLPYSVASFVIDDPGRVLAGEQHEYGPRLLSPLIETANLLGYTVYPVDIPGQAGSFGAEGRDEILAVPVNRFGDNLVIDTLERERQIEQAMHLIARSTGGRAVINADRTDAFEVAVADTRTYYWLGFTVDRQRDDREHDIRVEVTHPDLEVRAREGFKDLSAQTERTMMAESALFFGDSAAAPLEVELGKPQPDGRREMEMPITIQLPVGRMTALPTAEGHLVQMELRFAALDEESRGSEMPTVPVSLTLEEEPAENAVVPYDAKLRLRRIDQTLVVSVHDAVTGRQLAARVEVRP